MAILELPNDAKRIFGLDLLRVLAIFFVVHGHGAFLLQETMLAPFAIHSFSYEVDIFFILTGFLIGGAFIRHDGQRACADGTRLWRFYGKSVFRILPCYMFMLLVNALLVGVRIIPGDIQRFPLWRFATLTQNLFTPFYDFYWESWCLPVQWWFYLLFPLLLFLLARRFSVRKVVPWLCIFFVLLSLVYHAVVSEHALDDFWWTVWIRKTVLSRSDNIYIGVLAAWLQHYHPEGWGRHAGKSLVAGIMIMVLVCVLPRPVGTVYGNVFALSLPPVAIAMWLPCCCRYKNSFSRLGGVITGISVLSYAMYLTNLLICQIISSCFAEQFRQWGVGGYLIYWVMVLFASFVLHVTVEKPFMGLWKRWGGRLAGKL